MDLYDTELHEKVLSKMRTERIRDFSDVEIERVFSDFDLPEKTYLGIIDLLVSRGLTIDEVYERPALEMESDW